MTMSVPTDGKPKSPTDKLSWHNDLNYLNFYQIPSSLPVLKEYAEAFGLSSGCDIDIFFDEIKNAKELLDVGAGYGRAVQRLFSLGFSGKIHCVERSSVYCQQLALDFGDKIFIHQDDILNFYPLQQFDVALSLWSGICDFQPHRQQAYLQHLFQLLRGNGILYLDTALWNVQPYNVEYLSQQYYRIKINELEISGYIPSPEEIMTYAKVAGFSDVSHQYYHTDTHYKRLLYRLRK